MTVRLVADDRWLAIPSEFPTPEGESAAQWEDRVVSVMRQRWGGDLTPQLEPVVREALRHGVNRVEPDDTLTLQFWPSASFINAIVHIVVGTFEPGDERRVVPLDGGPFVTRPQSVLVESETLGTGVESAALIALDEEPPVTLGGLNYLFEGPVGYVYVGVDPTFPQLVGLIQAPLREVINTIRVDMEDGREWGRATVDEKALQALLSPDETWDFERAETAT
jgi:hypothetical protein